MKHESHALNKLHRSLGPRATLLECLDIVALRDEGQGEIPWAMPKAILYGHMKFKGPLHRRPLVWIYMCQKSLTLIFHSYHADGEAGGLLMLDDVLKKSAPVAAFDFATDPLKLVVLATYYFMRFDLNGSEHLVLTKRQEEVLLSICEDTNKANGSYVVPAPRSLVVKLPIKVPPALLVESSPSGKRKRGTVEPSDSGIDDMDSRRHMSTASEQFSSTGDSYEQQLSRSGNTDHEHLSDDNNESKTQQLERRRRRIEALRENLEAVQAELDQEVDEVLVMLEEQEQASLSAG